MIHEKQMKSTKNSIDWFADPDMPKDWEAVQNAGRFNKDFIVGAVAGAVKLPSDVGNLFGWEWAKHYENKVNSARDYLQSDKLNSDRIAAINMLQQGASLKDVANKYPEATMQYGLENLTIPVSYIGKGAKVFKTTLPYAKQLGRFKGGHPEVALGLGYLAASPAIGATNSVFQDYKESRVNYGNNRLETNR